VRRAEKPTTHYQKQNCTELQHGRNFTEPDEPTDQSEDWDELEPWHNLADLFNEDAAKVEPDSENECPPIKHERKCVERILRELNTPKENPTCHKRRRNQVKQTGERSERSGRRVFFVTMNEEFIDDVGKRKKRWRKQENHEL
jgi:hypothetical protein